MVSHLVQAILDAMHGAGWPVLFVVMALEMGMILHFLPTELVLIAATSQLARSPLGLAMVVVVATAGSALGGMLPYAAAYSGGRPFLERHQRFFHLSPQRLERLEALFQRRAGPGLVAGLRVVPGLRTAPSIPAGLARMPWRTYLALTTAGSLVFNFVLAYATYASGHPKAPLGEDLNDARQALAAELAKLRSYWLERWWLALLLLAAAALLTVLVWRRRHRIRAQPLRTTLHGLRLAAWAATAVAGLLVLGALVAPDAAYHVIAWFAIDFAQWASTSGFGPVLLVLIVASGFVSFAVLAFALLGLLAAYRDRKE